MADERRSIEHTLRAEGQHAPHLRGYALVFDLLSVDLGGFREIIRPDAVDRTLRDAADVRALVNHDPGHILGRTRAGTLVLRKDRTGLSVDIEPDTAISYAGDIVRAVSRGDVTGMSFAFRVPEGGDRWRYDETGQAVREVFDMDIREVSVVAFPAYPQTQIDVALRSLEAFRSAHPPPGAPPPPSSSSGRSVAWLRRVYGLR